MMAVMVVQMHLHQVLPDKAVMVQPVAAAPASSVMEQQVVDLQPAKWLPHLLPAAVAVVMQGLGAVLKFTEDLVAAAVVAV
jgi:hypothetical protein